MCAFQQWQVDPEGRSLADVGLKPDGSAHTLYNLLGDVQSKTAAALDPGRRRIPLRKFSEDLWPELLRDTAAVIPHRDANHVVEPPCRHIDRSAPMRELRGVGKKVRQHLRETCRIHFCGDSGLNLTRCQLDTELFGIGLIDLDSLPQFMTDHGDEF